MAKLYGKPTKFVRHANEFTYTIEPQRFQVHVFWRCDTSGATSRTDGLDLTDEVAMPLGSKVTKHKTEILVTPETIEPQQIYLGRLKLSFHDVLAEPITGMTFDQTTHQGAVTPTAKTNPITPQLWFDDDGQAVGHTSGNLEIGGSASGYGIQEWKLDDNIHHFINLKKVTVFDQRPLMGERFQRIPSKVKRINPYTFYGLVMFNDSPRGATPADTQVKINIKDYFEEMAL